MEEQTIETEKKAKRKKTVAEIEEQLKAKKEKLKRELLQISKKQKELTISKRIKPLMDLLKNNFNVFDDENLQKIKECIQAELNKAKEKKEIGHN